MSKILITGATGGLGSSTIQFLIKRVDPSDIAVLVRDESKVEDIRKKGVDIRIGDYDNYESLKIAFQGIDTLLFISGNDIVNRKRQHLNVIKAAKEAGVKHVIYTSFVRKNETNSSPIYLVAESHLQTEQWLIDSGLKYTILQNNIYMDMLPMFLGEKMLEDEIAYFPAGEGKVAFTLREDMAEAAAIILSTKGHENKIYELSNSEAVGFDEMVTIISRTSGKNITYVSPENAAYINTLTAAGVPAEYVGMFAGFAEAFRQGEFEKTGTTLESLIGRKPVSVSEFFEQVYSN
jgi:NAD(P)H dehydrogenase (quinone)